MLPAQSSRAEEYRIRATAARSKAEATNDEQSRASLLQDAVTWERMAKWEDNAHWAAGYPAPNLDTGPGRVRQ
jgi:hypothetical protein